MSTTADQIVSQLDAYAGDNIWEDVIYHLDGFDGAATDELNPITTAWDDNRFIAAGVAYWQTDAGWFSVNAAEFDR